jgi:hypothetical protein
MRRAWSLTQTWNHRLAGVLQQIDNPRVLILKKNRFAIRHQVEIGGCVEQLGEAAAHFPLQEAPRFQETGVTFLSTSILAVTAPSYRLLRNDSVVGGKTPLS